MFMKRVPVRYLLSYLINYETSISSLLGLGATYEGK